jgi:hypothetical protein
VIAEEQYQQARGWAATARELADTLRNDRGLLGEDWVMLNALAEDLETYANDLLSNLIAGK